VTTLDFSFSFDVSIFWEKAMTQSLFDFFVLRGWQLQQVDFRINEKKKTIFKPFQIATKALNIPEK
jgi:hypothetical protein